MRLGLCGADDLRAHVRGQPAGFRANCNYTCTGCTRSPTSVPTSVPTSAPSLSPSVLGAWPFLGLKWSSNGGTEPLDFGACRRGVTRGVSTGVTGGKRAPASTCSDAFIDEFKASLLADINSLISAVWLGDTNTDVVCTGTGCTVSFLEGTGLSTAEVHALAAGLDASHRSMTVSGVVYTLSVPVTSGSNTRTPTPAPVQKSPKNSSPFSGYVNQGLSGSETGGSTGRGGANSNSIPVGTPPPSKASVKGRKKQKKSKKKADGSTDGATASAKGSGHDVAAIAAGSLAAGVLLAVLGALLWTKLSAKKSDRQLLEVGARSSVSSEGVHQDVLLF